MDLRIPSSVKNRPRLWLSILAGVVIIIILLRLHSCNSSTSASLRAGRNQLPPVVLALARSSDVPVYLSALGAVTPTFTVTVKTQINGRLMQVLFREGQTVKLGELLAVIDPRPYQAQLTQFEGQLTHDRALLANARLDLKRYTTLFQQNSVAKQILDTQTWLVKQYEGTVTADQGQVDSVRVNLTYCQITSPIAGRVGLRLVDPGNYVQTTDANGLVIINTIDPITVIFTIPEDNVPQVIKQINLGKPLIAEAYDREQNKLLATGTLLTIDNQIDPTTGTVKLKAQFKNSDNRLFPSQFVNIQFLVDTLHKATVIPTAAIQRGAQGPFVYLVNNNHKVSVKPVVLGVTTGNDTTVTAGVTPGQSVVIEGADKLTDGATVTIAPAMKAAPPPTQIGGDTHTQQHVAT